MKSHSFNIQDALLYGIEEAIILNNISFWIDKNRANQKHFYDGAYWTYNSYNAFALLFPYMSTHQIKRAITNLEVKGVIKSGNYNSSPYDKTKWYSVLETTHEAKNDHRADEFSQPIPNVNTDHKLTDNKTDKKTMGSPSFIEVEDFEKGKEKSCAKKEKGFEPKNEIEKQGLEVLTFLNENRRQWLKATRDFLPTSKVHFQFITARLKTYSVDDLKAIIAVKFMQWYKSPKMSKYLTPDTLFNETNCAKYIQEVDIAKLNPNYQNEQRDQSNPKARPDDSQNIAAIHDDIDKALGGRR